SCRRAARAAGTRPRACRFQATGPRRRSAGRVTGAPSGWPSAPSRRHCERSLTARFESIAAGIRKGALMTAPVVLGLRSCSSPDPVTFLLGQVLEGLPGELQLLDLDVLAWRACLLAVGHFSLPTGCRLPCGSRTGQKIRSRPAGVILEHLKAVSRDA